MPTPKKKITIPAVLNAYKNTHLTPVVKKYFDKARNAGCALTALFCNSKSFEGAEEVRDSSEVEAWAENKFGRYYTQGFITGFDNERIQDQTKLEKLVSEVVDTGSGVRNKTNRNNAMKGILEGNAVRRYLEKVGMLSCRTNSKSNKKGNSK